MLFLTFGYHCYLGGSYWCTGYYNSCLFNWCKSCYNLIFVVFCRFLVIIKNVDLPGSGVVVNSSSSSVGNVGIGVVTTGSTISDAGGTGGGGGGGGGGGKKRFGFLVA